jgi:peptidoglycan/LPS O-acetylase OafA/YrhL
VVPVVLGLTAGWATMQPAVSSLHGAHGALGGAEFFVASFFALTLLMLHPYDTRMSDCAVLRPIQWCGVRCYSMYLVHYPIAVLLGNAAMMAGLTSNAALLAVTLPGVIASVVGVSAVFHRWCEVPWLNRPRRAEESSPAAVAVT